MSRENEHLRSQITTLKAEIMTFDQGPQNLRTETNADLSQSIENEMTFASEVDAYNSSN